MGSGDGIPRWCVYDSIKIPTKPDALMAEINSAISSLEYAKATKLLNTPVPLSKNMMSIDDGNPNASSLYDARKADEAYKAGLAYLTAGNLEEAFQSLNVALSKCPPNKTSAVAKLRSLITLTAQRLTKSPGKDYDFDASTEDYIFVDSYVYDESYNFTLYDCKRICWSNCSCVAYTYANENKTGCKTFGQMIYNPAEARRHPYTEYYAFKYLGEKKMERKKKTNMTWMWVIFIIVSLALLLSSYLVYKKLDVRVKAKEIQLLLLHQQRRLYKYVRKDKKMNTEPYYFTFQSISSATNNFSSTNKLGEGGFGAVYKGTLVDGQEVAVKRLSRSSAQGDKEFKNETELIAKLQHINLVRLLGYCIEKQEKILVYEYMPNHSLNFFLFDSRKKGLLDWNKRLEIIDGIAQGLVYLHKFSRLTVIHRDLKASNILLDDYMKPKISDFGMAKLFGINESKAGINESKANTSRVVGTRGYMPPEYMMEGSVSTKTDVFSFGVLLLEIVSGKMNQGSYDVEHPPNLPGLAWELWKEGRGLELMDQVLEDSCTPKEVMACIQVGLLCVQNHVTDRPTISQVISMLTNEKMHLMEPKQPAFFIERGESQASRDYNLGNGSVNGQSISVLVAR